MSLHDLMMEKGLEQSKVVDFLCAKLGDTGDCPTGSPEEDCQYDRYPNDCLECWRKFAFDSVRKDETK